MGSFAGGWPQMVDLAGSPELVFTSAVLVLSLAAFHVLRRLFIEANSPSHAVAVPLPAAAQPGWHGEIVHDARLKTPGLSAVNCHCPSTGQSLGHVNPATADGIDRAIEAAAKAQREWAKTTWTQRRQVLKTLLRFVLAHQEDLARVAARDSGKPLLDASYGEILVTAEKLRWTLKHGERALRPERRPTSLLMAYKKNEVVWEPLGVVAALVSWNYPFHNFVGPVISSLFSGNAIVVKPSERTAWSSAYFLAVVRACLKACGHSPHLVHSLVLWPQTAAHLTSHPGISHITFIGSRPVSKQVLASAATAVTPVCAELGGKDPAIVLDDATDLAATADVLLRGSFQAAGQNCIGIERIIALPKVYTQLIALLEPKIRALRLGSSLDEPNVDVGAMISEDGFTRLEQLIQDAVAQGARLLVGGHRHLHPQYPAGHYFAATLLVDVEPHMRIAQEELFAPVCMLMRAANVQQAITIANAAEYHLGASVFGQARRDLDSVVHGIKAGMVAVNDFAVFYAVQLPFGGVAGSGFGRFAGEEGLRSLCNTKAICRDRWSLIRTKIPPAHVYPIPNAQKAWSLAAGVVLLACGPFVDKIRGLKDILGSL